MFGSQHSHQNGAPEISEGASSSAPRSWSNLTRWAFRKPQHEAVRGEAPSSNVSSKDMLNSYAAPSAAERRLTEGDSRTLIGIKHVLVFLAFSFPVIALALVLKIPAWYAFHADYWVDSFTHCNFNGIFTPYDQPSISLWAISGFFYISVSWGKMAFSTAKFIDIVWDIAVGRAGQALLAFITFRVSSQYLAMAMREAPVSYNTFESLAFVPPSLIRTGRLAGDLLTNRGWRARLIIIWIVLSSLFVLSFSTLVTAMSGYSSNVYAVMPDYEGRSVVWTNFQVVQFSINDAWRIGEPEPVVITMGDTCVHQGFLDDDDDDDDDSGNYHDSVHSRRDDNDDDDDDNDGDGQGIPWEYVPFNCTVFWRTVQYVQTYGLHGTNQTESTITLNGMTHNLAAPALNITTSYSPLSLSILSTYLETFSLSSPPGPLALKPVSELTDATFWTFANQTYPFAYVLDHATCRYSRWHNWGFSFLLLFITTLLLALWAIGTYALWLYVHLHNQRNGYARDGVESTGGIFQSSWTLVEAMRRDVGPGAVSSGMTEKDIRDQVRRRSGRILHGVGQMPMSDELRAGDVESEKRHAPVISSPIQQPLPSRWAVFRSWLFRDSRPASQDRNHIQTQVDTPANSVFSNANSTFSSTSQHPILLSPAPLGKTSRMSSLASPDSFGFSIPPPVNTEDFIEGSDLVSSPISMTAGDRKSPMRPKLSRIIPSSSSNSTAFPPSGITNARSPSFSFSPTTTRWAGGPSSPSDASTLTTSPVREDRRAHRDSIRRDHRGSESHPQRSMTMTTTTTTTTDDRDKEIEGDAVRWRNDLGDD